MDLLFSIGLAIVVGGVLLFLLVAIRSYLSPKRRSAVGNGLAPSALASGEYGRLGGFDTDTPDRQDDQASSEFDGGGTGGSYGEADAGVASANGGGGTDE